MKWPRARSVRNKLLAIVVGSTLVAGLLGGVAVPASANHGPIECPEILPKSEIHKGMQATGYTVYRGKTPTAFGVEVLGILRDGIGPGRDMIVVDTSGPMIEEVGGIWYGMSGSPVYFEDRFLGALAFGLSWGPSSVAGLTPAEDMAHILDYPREEPEASPLATQRFSANSVSVPASMSRTIAAETGTSEEQVGDEFERLRMPLSISGLTSHAMSKVKKVIKRENLPFIPYAGSSASAADATTGRVQPGGNFAAAISYGDVTFAGTGTTSYVCGDVALAFGHPFFFEGSTTFGANDADALVIVDDPLFGPYKLAQIEERAGMVDQDRLAGLRAFMGELPPAIPITTTTTNLDLNRSREGRTESVSTRFTPFIAFIHVLTNIDTIFDQISEGSSELSWTITGTREGGGTWELPRSNMYASEWDIAFESVFELLFHLYTLYYNDFEDIEFTGIDLDASVREEVLAYKITDVHVSKNGLEFKDTRRIRAKPGQTIYLQVFLATHDESRRRVVQLDVTIPEDARREGLIEVSGGQNRHFYCFFSRRCVDDMGNKIESFDDLLTALQNQPKNNELMARLRMGNRGRVKAQDAAVLDQVVRGRKRIFLMMGSGDSGEGGSVKPVPCAC